MQIQLKQLEIVAALKMFITSQGINLTGKTVEIAFTSGRKDNGLSAEITIEDATVAGSVQSFTNHGLASSVTNEMGSVINSATTEEVIPKPPEADTQTGYVTAPAKSVSLFS